MDAVMFEVKGTHLAAQRQGRVMLRRFGLTPARFDLMHALGRDGMKQSDLWKRLNVTRSVVCEMVHALKVLGWVARVRAADSRTWMVRLTRRGWALFERAYDACVESGDAALRMDQGLARGYVEIDGVAARNEFLFVCEGIQWEFRPHSWFGGRPLYVWKPEDYYAWLTDPDEPPGDVPFVTDN
jgi:DNA-binding MarR family transcriptional regulator